jgi:hypothetical protein
MKAIFTFLLIMVFAVSSFSQPTTPYTSVVENKSFSLSKVYPNPVKDIVTVELYSVVAGDIQVNLYNILGVQVKVWDPIYLSQGDQQIKLDLSLIKSGIYILKIVQSGKVCSQVVKKS